MTTGKPYASSGMEVQVVGARAPAPLRVSLFIAGAGSILLLYGAVTMPGSGIFELVVAATLMLVLWSGVLFDWFVSKAARVQTATTLAPMQLAPRPSRVPPSPARLDRAA